MADAVDKAAGIDGADLLGLGLGVAVQPTAFRGNEDMERESRFQGAGDRHDRHRAAAEVRCSKIGVVVADNDAWTAFVSFAALGRFQVNEPDVASPHAKPSAAVTSQSPAMSAVHAASY